MKFNTRLKAVAAAAALLGSAFSANAAFEDLGNVSLGTAPTSFNAASSYAGPFTDIFTFTLTSNANVGFSVLNLPVLGVFNSVITSASLFSSGDGQLFNQDDELIANGTFPTTNGGSVLTSTSLNAGTYYLNITGIGNGSMGGAYSGALAAVSVAAVPEPETYAMLLAGMGVMGFIARRRNKISK